MAAPAAEENRGRRAGWLFGAVTVVPALLAAAWLLPAFPLLLSGRFSALPMVFMFAPLAAGLCYFAVRQLPATWPSFRREHQSREHQSREHQSREHQKSPCPGGRWRPR